MSQYILSSTSVCTLCGEPLVREWLIYWWPRPRHAHCGQVATMRAARPEMFTTEPEPVGWSDER